MSYKGYEMLVTEKEKSVVKRSTSIWRRLSKREPRRKVDPEHIQPVQKLQKRTVEPQKAQLPPKLQRRQSEPSKSKPTKQMIAHLQRVELPVKRADPKPVSARRVVAADMRTTPFPPSPHVRTVSWNVFLTPEQVYSLVIGFSPAEMDDKWFVYSEGPDQSGKLKVHFHRSWTGLKIAELFVVIDLKGEGAGKIVGVKWNGTEQTNRMDEEEAKYMVSTTCSWVLGVDLERDKF